MITKLEGHTGSIVAVAFAPDGATLATGSADRTVRLWDVAGSRLLHTLGGHGDAVRCVAFSHDGALLASGSRDRTVRLWEVSTGQLLATLEGHRRPVQTIAWGTDGETLLTASAERVRRWRAADGAVLHEALWHGRDTDAMAISPDEAIFAVGSATGNVALGGVADGQLLHAWRSHAYAVDDVAFSPDGSLLLSAGGYNLGDPHEYDNATRVWRLPDAGLERELPSSGSYTHGAAWSPDGRLIAHGEGGEVVLWNAGTGARLNRLPLRTGPLWSVRFSPDGRQLACVGDFPDAWLVQLPGV